MTYTLTLAAIRLFRPALTVIVASPGLTAVIVPP